MLMTPPENAVDPKYDCKRPGGDGAIDVAQRDVAALEVEGWSILYPIEILPEPELAEEELDDA